ncbi:MAG: peptidoglycan recognition family protein [Clostridia bacterium]
MIIQEKLLSKSEMTRSFLKQKKIKYIVIHSVEKANMTAMFNRDYIESLSKQRDKYYSTHYIIGLDGEIIRCIPENEVAYHCEKIDINFESIAISCCTNLDDSINENVKFSLSELINDLCFRYKLKKNNVVLHFDISSSRCPKYFVDNKMAFDNVLKYVPSF